MPQLYIGGQPGIVAMSVALKKSITFRISVLLEIFLFVVMLYTTAEGPNGLYLWSSVLWIINSIVLVVLAYSAYKKHPVLFKAASERKNQMSASAIKILTQTIGLILLGLIALILVVGIYSVYKK